MTKDEIDELFDWLNENLSLNGEIEYEFDSECSCFFGTRDKIQCVTIDLDVVQDIVEYSEKVSQCNK